MIRNKAYDFFLDHVLNEKLGGKLYFIVFRPIFHSKHDQEKNFKLHFLNVIKGHYSSIVSL
jgi:hypothetical protein